MQPLYSSFCESFHKNLWRAGADERIIGAPIVATFAQAGFFDQILPEHPQNVFFRLDTSLNVLGADGQAFMTLREALEQSATFIPVFYVNDSATVDALAAFAHKNHIADAAVCVPYQKRELLSRVLLLSPMLRRMIDGRTLTAADLQTECDCYRLAGDTWEANCATIILPDALCSRRVVQCLQRRFVQVFAACGDRSPAPATLAGVNGLICEHPTRAYALFDRLPPDTITRRVLVYAHKGLQNEGENPENTVTSVTLAQKAGMDGAEIDIKLSRDGVPILMHDFSTNKMLNTTHGQIYEELLWDDIRAMERVRHPGEFVDRLEDVMAAIKGKDYFPVMVEFKPREGYYHIERMAHMLQNLIDTQDMEYQTVITMGETPPNLNYVQTVLPRIPKIFGLWENIKDPADVPTIEAFLFRLTCRMAGKTAVPTLEDVMVNRLFGEQARLRALPPFVWMRGDYYYPSQWEDACHRSDNALLCGFFGSCADHAARYFHLFLSLCRDEDGSVWGILRSGERVPVENAQLCDLGDGYAAYAVRQALPMGQTFVLCTEAFRV
ncbi:MAG: hypothetical protein IJY66_02310 [Clostridia bacterium]|nr:hypothetical protein [Clostridia bacterium]